VAWFEYGPARIYYEEQGEGDPVLMVPGFTGSIEEFATLRQALVERYRVIAADPPGSGRSGPQPRLYSVDYYQEDADALAALLQHLDAAPAHLLGFSDGGEYGLLLAATKPQMARSVVAWGAAGVLHDPGGRMREAMVDIIDNPIPPLQELSDHLIATYGAASARAMMQSAMRAGGEIIDVRNGDISLSKARDIACPVLLIVGDQDMFLPVELAQQYPARVPQGEVLVAEGAGHAVHLDRPEWMEQTVLDWLKRH
jgi:valacyclovir hydrolase